MAKKVEVLGENGLVGHIDEHIGTLKHVELSLLDGREVLIPVDALKLQTDGRYHLLADLVDLLEESVPRQDNAEIRLLLAAEEMQVNKRQRVTGHVRINKKVMEREQIVTEPLMRQLVDVKRVPVNRVVSEAEAVRQEGDTTIIPVMEEMLVFERRLVVKEELHITLQKTTFQEPQSVMLRYEDVTIERKEADAPTGTNFALG